MLRTANILGSGPNGLAAAIKLAQAGCEVSVYERNAQLGGACASAELTLPGFLHDLGGSALPMAAASPFLQSLPLAQYGFRFVQPEFALAHPLDDGTGVVLTPSLAEMAGQLSPPDAGAWRRLFSPIVASWQKLIPEILGPVLHVPRHPLALARFGLPSLLSATGLARTVFSDAPAQALFAGCAAHSVMPLDAPLSASVAIVLVAAGHTLGWPVSGGGSQSLVNAMAAHLESLGGTLNTAHEITSLDAFVPGSLTLFDTSTSALDRIAGARLSSGYRANLRRFEQGPGIFKIDWALSEAIPWTAKSCRGAGTIHVGGSMEEIAYAEAEVFAGRHAEKPLVILVQPTVADPSRTPAGKHTAWGYCHVPNGSTLDRTETIERQIERFAPGFRDAILARRTWSTAQLEAWNPNLLGGDVSGGAMTARQLLMRPTIREYGTSDPSIYLCSSATSPGGGIHGMCGYHAARLALARQPRTLN